ncbi:hypothetical protein W02_38160 [Nitrospira sp. KM1]|uniref:hypothetical protein n=1 Tax=Nitrospira sp. KM1 TaxID=1936990 RepID=UPI0013A743BC|nr:hypothetical protein [Nitrospira sp. KM1]BCA56676.1 hypothetical protein W02_38160 [Nitrospira sp. KM1]
MKLLLGFLLGVLLATASNTYSLDMILDNQHGATWLYEGNSLGPTFYNNPNTGQSGWIYSDGNSSQHYFNHLNNLEQQLRDSNVRPCPH